ncbi:MAG: TIGR00730 family Rossman fold protein [Actinomycetota bacterium]|nr:TIGR00730 family Rossman fold protein [Actinomycetota bacterium]
MGDLRSICVFCGSNPGTDPAFVAAARAVGEGLAARDIGVVYGGGRVGMMGALADGARGAGGRVTGVIPRDLMAREIGHTGLDDLRVVGSMHERKALMAELSDAFIALPGGIGTLEELFEVYTWAQLGIHAKPIGLLDVAGFYAPLAGFLDHVVDQGFLRDQTRAALTVAGDLDALLTAMDGAPPIGGHKWTEIDSA